MAVPSWFITADLTASREPVLSTVLVRFSSIADPMSPSRKVSPNVLFPASILKPCACSSLLRSIIWLAVAFPAASAKASMLSLPAPNDLASASPSRIESIKLLFKKNIPAASAPRATITIPRPVLIMGRAILTAIMAGNSFWATSPTCPGAIDAIIIALDAAIPIIPTPPAERPLRGACCAVS